MSQGKFVGGKQPVTGSGEQPAAATGKEGGGASQRVIRNKEKPRREQPIEPKGKGLDQPVGLKKTAAKNDQDFFNDRGFVAYPRPKGAAGLSGALFDAAVIQRMSREELEWATDQILTMGRVKRDDLTVVDDLSNAATRFGSEKEFLDYHRGFTRNQLIGVDDERLKAGMIFMEASRNLGHTSPAQQRLRARRKTTENPPERKGEQGDWVWGLNNVFRAVQLRRDRMAGASVLTNPGRQDPGLAPKAKQPGLNAQDVTTSKQQAAFARQQQQAAQAAGDQRGAQAWRKEERTVERNRLATAMNSSKQSQSSLFGVTEYDETMPLFKKRGDSRLDARRKKCVTGYSCGATCIPMGKQCRITPMAAISQRRLKRLMNLAGGSGSPREPGGVSPTDRRIAALNAARNEIGRSLVADLSKQRADGQGNYIEHPDASAMQRIKAAGVRVAKIDRQLNVLEGKDPNKKRWIDGDPFGLARYSDLQSPGRKAYERKVIAMEIKGATVGDQAVFMSGGPASGKTSLLKKQFGAAEGFAVIDPDRIKDYDPVMAIGVAMGMRKAAALAHENSSRLSKEVYATAASRGFNVLLDGTGANAGKYIHQMQELRGKGYQVTLLAQHVPEEVGVKRAMDRADSTGRFVPREFIEHAYGIIPGNFERLAGVADRATLNDGESNQVIMEYEAGRLVGGSRKRMADYRKRYGKPDAA